MAESNNMNEKRAAFLSGEGTLTVLEVNDWAQELMPYTRTGPQAGLEWEAKLMVSVAPDDDGDLHARMPAQEPRPTPPHGDLSRPARPC